MSNQTSAKEDFLAGCIASMLMPVFLVALFALKAWMVWLLWGWFLVPLGVPAASFPLCFGLTAAVTLVWYRPDIAKDKGDADGLKLFWAFFFPWLLLGFGWVAHFFV